MPDIDIDFDDEGRGRVIDYVIDKYGASQVAQIITYGKMAAKSAIRDTARVLELPLGDADRIAKLIPDLSLGKIFSFDDKKLKDKLRSEEMREQGKIQICPLAYIRGRSLSNVIFIVDEAQNLTPHEVKTIITRAGENTKIILTGDVRQIDTPYLDEQSNGLTYVIDRLKGKDLYCHITLEKGERSDLANLANDNL